MTDIPGLFVLVVVLAGILATHSIWAPRRLRTKLFALFVTLLFLPLAYAAMVQLLSKPKPVHLEWWKANAAEASVLASTFEEGQGIYLWLQMADLVEPRAYVLPWDRELAEELQEAMREAEQNGGGVRMRMPFEPSLDNREPRFYALPQPAFPPKDRDGQGPELFAGPSTDA